jgi:hypothetical protein
MSNFVIVSSHRIPMLSGSKNQDILVYSLTELSRPDTKDVARKRPKYLIGSFDE